MHTTIHKIQYNKQENKHDKNGETEKDSNEGNSYEVYSQQYAWKSK